MPTVAVNGSRFVNITARVKAESRHLNIHTKRPIAASMGNCCKALASDVDICSASRAPIISRVCNAASTRSGAGGPMSAAKIPSRVIPRKSGALRASQHYSHQRTSFPSSDMDGEPLSVSERHDTVILTRSMMPSMASGYCKLDEPIQAGAREGVWRSGSHCFTLTLPGSTTYTTWGIVMEVSAILVLRMTLRTPRGSRVEHGLLLSDRDSGVQVLTDEWNICFGY
jgi:hypothetical protein